MMSKEKTIRRGLRPQNLAQRQKPIPPIQESAWLCRKRTTLTENTCIFPSALEQIEPNMQNPGEPDIRTFEPNMQVVPGTMDLLIHIKEGRICRFPPAEKHCFAAIQTQTALPAKITLKREASLVTKMSKHLTRSGSVREGDQAVLAFEVPPRGKD